jgi:predicted LPLAT superfamily acyltransferase
MEKKNALITRASRVTGRAIARATYTSAPSSSEKMSARDSKTSHWSGTGQLRGGRRGIWFFITAVRVLGLRLTYVLTVPPSIYFSFASPDVAATMDYHRRVFGPLPWWKRRWFVFKHFLSFGRALIDRTAILAGDRRHFLFSFDDEKNLRAALAEGRGVLLLTAHVGNWEAAGQLLSRVDVPINVTGFDKETPQIRSLLTAATQTKFRFLPLTGSPTDIIPLVAALRRGEIVAMLGDRAYGSPSARIPFLGGTAAFPIGAYAMAAIAGAPLMHTFNLREPGGRYRFFGFPPQHPRMPPHNERAAYLKNCAANFARDLETILKRDPLQWYNFYPFWERSADSHVRESSETLTPLADKAVRAPR